MKPRNCDTKDTKIIVTTEEKGVTVNAPGTGSDYHYSQLVSLDGLIPTYWCTGAIWAFSGHVALPQATFDGNKDDPLRFEMKETGLTYVAGQGNVVLRDGTPKRLGQAVGVTGTNAPASDAAREVSASANVDLTGSWRLFLISTQPDRQKVSVDTVIKQQGSKISGYSMERPFQATISGSEIVFQTQPHTIFGDSNGDTTMKGKIVSPNKIAGEFIAQPGYQSAWTWEFDRK